MDKICINNQTFKIEIERKKIKNIYLRFIDPNYLKITCPKYCSDKQIDTFIETKKVWIVKTSELLKRKLATNSYSVDDNLIVLFGKQYEIVVRHSDKTNNLYIDENKAIFVLKEDTQANRNLAYFNYAIIELSQLVLNLRGQWDEMIMNDYHLQAIPKITIKSLKSRWGECIPSKNEIKLSSMLAHYPIEAINAVLLHEYVHLIVPNHSQRFYNIINMHMPLYKQYHQLLKY